jgi:NTP pyrophosphatase (non-canonical NTP hydrolase)
LFDELTKRIVEFRDARDWRQYHSPKNLAGSIVIEAAELLETLQWSSDATIASDVEANRTDIARELADITIYCLLMAHETGIDLESAVVAKLNENEAKYPVAKARGRREKYDRL